MIEYLPDARIYILTYQKEHSALIYFCYASRRCAELIDEYLSETELPQEKINIIKLWRTNHKKGMFFILEYQPEYAVAIASDEQGEDRLYGVKGISNSVANTLLMN